MVDDQETDPYQGVAPLLDLAQQWLTRSGGANAPLVWAAYDLRWRGDWRLSIHRKGADVEGVSVVMPGGHWLIEATTPMAASALANTAVIHDRRPTTLTTSARVAEWLRPLLTEHGALAAERTLRILSCEKPSSSHEGRWATTDDLAKLAAYEKQIKSERREDIDTSWDALIARKELAIVEDGGGIVASLRRYGRAPTSAAVADLYVVPAARQSKAGSNLAGFVVSDLLSQRKVVYAAVDETDSPGLASYTGAGFIAVGTCSRALLK